MDILERVGRIFLGVLHPHYLFRSLAVSIIFTHVQHRDFVTMLAYWLLTLSLLCGEGWAWGHASRDALQKRLDLGSEAPVLVACELMISFVR